MIEISTVITVIIHVRSRTFDLFFIWQFTAQWIHIWREQWIHILRPYYLLLFEHCRFFSQELGINCISYEFIHVHLKVH